MSGRVARALRRIAGYNTYQDKEFFERTKKYKDRKSKKIITKTTEQHRPTSPKTRYKRLKKLYKQGLIKLVDA